MSLLLQLELSIEEDLLLFLLEDEGRLADGITVTTTTCSWTSYTHQVRLLVAFLI